MKVVDSGQRKQLAPVGFATSALGRMLPRRVTKRIEMTQRDVRMLFGGLLGTPPPPLVERPPRHEPSSSAAVIPLRRSGVTARPARVTRVVHETHDAISLYLAEADGSALTYLPGQFLTVDVEVDGERLRRAYSLASAALPGHEAHITVKRLEGGRVSNHLGDHVGVGDELAVLGPSGAFTVEPDLMGAEHLVLIAGGSGITPIMSIAHTVLEVRPRGRVTLLYGNRAIHDVIFRERLAELVAAHGDRFTVDHVLDVPHSDWRGAVGQLDRAMVLARLEVLGIDEEDAPTYFVCGPTPMMDSVRDALSERDVPAERLREERFTRPEARSRPTTTSAQQLKVHYGEDRRVGVVEAGQTLLEAGFALGLDMPFSCAMGGCGACRVKVVEGNVESDEPNCLTPDEKAEGYALACCSRPTEAVTIEVEA